MKKAKKAPSQGAEAKEQPSLGMPKNPVHVETDDSFEALLRTYEHNQHWVTLADTKAGLVLTINGVLAGFMLQQMVVWKKAIMEQSVSDTVLWLGGICVAIYFLFQILSFLFTIQVFFPRSLDVDYTQCRHIFNIGIVKAYPNPEDREKMWEEYRKLSEQDLKREYVYQLHTDSIICTRKYKSVTLCLKFLLAAISFAFITFVITGIFLK